MAFDIFRYGLSPSAFPTAVTSLLMILFGGSVILRRVSRVTVTFLALSSAASIWLIAFTLMYCTPNAAHALFWARVAYLGVPVIAAAIYHFTAEMLHIYERRKAAGKLGRRGMMHDYLALKCWHESTCTKVLAKKRIRT